MSDADSGGIGRSKKNRGGISGDKRRQNPSGTHSVGGKGTLIQDKMWRQDKSLRGPECRAGDTAAWLVERMAVTIVWDLCNLCLLFFGGWGDLRQGFSV